MLVSQWSHRLCLAVITVPVSAEAFRELQISGELGWVSLCRPQTPPAALFPSDKEINDLKGRLASTD